MYGFNNCVICLNVNIKHIIYYSYVNDARLSDPRDIYMEDVRRYSDTRDWDVLQLTSLKLHSIYLI